MVAVIYAFCAFMAINNERPKRGKIIKKVQAKQNFIFIKTNP